MWNIYHSYSLVWSESPDVPRKLLAYLSWHLSQWYVHVVVYYRAHWLVSLRYSHGICGYKFEWYPIQQRCGHTQAKMPRLVNHCISIIICVVICNNMSVNVSCSSKSVLYYYRIHVRNTLWLRIIFLKP